MKRGLKLVLIAPIAAVQRVGESSPIKRGPKDVETNLASVGSSVRGSSPDEEGTRLGLSLLAIESLNHLKYSCDRWMFVFADN